ncbi:MAG: hypothetical protein ACK4M9_19490 [Anaerobacillus sp.]|uniref:hypothetical protein n=1 Tax=Anaerobacillus sp. TaxID=1872506 RepID=UPI00391939D2
MTNLFFRDLEQQIQIFNQYLELKKDEFLIEIINSSTLSAFGINFATFFDKLIFTLLYEYESYGEIIEEIMPKINEKVILIPNIERDLLFSSNDVVNEYIEKVNNRVLDHVSLINNINLGSILEELRNDIEDFSYKGSMDSDDYNLRSYWEEFCFQLQYRGGEILEIILYDVEDHIYKVVKKMPMRDIISLFVQTNEFKYKDYELFDKYPLPNWHTVRAAIVDFLKDEIINLAYQEYIPDFSSGEEWVY